MQFLPSRDDSVGRRRFVLTIIFALNFLAFLLHTIRDGWATAFPFGGTLNGAHYTVVSHGRPISFTPAGYQFSYFHGFVFAVVSFVCIVWLWYLRRNPQSASDASV